MANPYPFENWEKPGEILDEVEIQIAEEFQLTELRLSLSKFSNLVAEVRREYRGNSEEIERMMDNALHNQRVSLEPFRTAYKRALGKLFGERARRKQFT